MSKPAIYLAVTPPVARLRLARLPTTVKTQVRERVERAPLLDRPSSKSTDELGRHGYELLGLVSHHAQARPQRPHRPVSGRPHNF